MSSADSSPLSSELHQNSGRHRSGWHRLGWQHWREALKLNRLREHPEFDFALECWPEKERPQHAKQGALPLEMSREDAFRHEQVRLYRDRLRIVSIVGLVMLPLFTLFYMLISPEGAQFIMIPHLLLMAWEIVAYTMAGKFHTLRALRNLVFGSYAMFCTGVGWSIASLSASPLFFSDSLTGTRTIELAAATSHAQIMISILLLPIVLWEGALIASIVTLTISFALWRTMQHQDFVVQVFMLTVSACLTLLIVHLQSVLRRANFDATFSLAHSANQMRARSVRDEVTGGFNRRHVEELLDVEMSRAARFNRPTSLLMFDLDGFKAVNDTSGHVRGDEVLREVMQAAQEAVREVDTVARFGGDEFAVVLPETDEANAVRIAERLRAHARTRLGRRWGTGPESCVTLSVGVLTLYPKGAEPGISVRDFIEKTDEKLYAAKRAGKNRIAF